MGIWGMIHNKTSIALSPINKIQQAQENSEGKEKGKVEVEEGKVKCIHKILTRITQNIV